MMNDSLTTARADTSKQLSASATTVKKPNGAQSPAMPPLSTDLLINGGLDDELPSILEIIRMSQEKKTAASQAFGPKAEKFTTTPTNSFNNVHSPKTQKLLSEIRSRRANSDTPSETPSKKRSFISISSDSDSDAAPKTDYTHSEPPTKRRLFTSSHTLPVTELSNLVETVIDQIDWEKLCKDVATNRGTPFYRRSLKDALQPPSAFNLPPRIKPTTHCPPISTYEMRRLSRSVLFQVDFKALAEEMDSDRGADYYHDAVRTLLKKMENLIQKEEGNV